MQDQIIPMNESIEAIDSPVIALNEIKLNVESRFKNHKSGWVNNC